MTLARAIKAGVNLRCDFCHKQIPKTKVAYQIKEGKAQGIFHGRHCYEAALKKYKDLEKQEGLG